MEDQTGVVTLDVRSMPPRERHPAIFSVFDGLRPGQILRLVNDHDPRPLYYQFQAERPGQVEWLPQQEDPTEWVIHLRKLPAAGAAPAPSHAPGETSGSPQRPPQHLAEPITAVDLAATVDQIRREPAYQQGNRNAITLVKLPGLRVVVTAMKAGARLQQHHAASPLTIQTLVGRLRLHLPNRTVELPAGQMLVLDRNVPHDAEALEESAFLLTLSGE